MTVYLSAINILISMFASLIYINHVCFSVWEGILLVGGDPKVPPSSSVSSTEECTDFLPVISIFSFTNPGSTLH